MSTKTPECWESDPNAAGVKIILAPDDHLLLPFEQFVYADLKPYGEHQQLRLVFVTHEVSVRGDSLERIETIMQRKHQSLLKTLPSHVKRCFFLVSTRFPMHNRDQNKTESCQSKNEFFALNDNYLNNWEFSKALILTSADI